MDMVLGVDIHFEMVPMPAPVPTPIPNPFVGMVYDPGGSAHRGRRWARAGAADDDAAEGPRVINLMPATTPAPTPRTRRAAAHLDPARDGVGADAQDAQAVFKGPPPPPGPPVAPEGDAIVVLGSPTVTFMGTSACAWAIRP